MQSSSRTVLSPREVALLSRALRLTDTPPREVEALAIRVLDHHGPLRQALSRPPAELAQTPGISEDAAAFLVLLSCLEQTLDCPPPIPGMPLYDPAQVARLLPDEFWNEPAEQTYLLCLDRDGRMLTLLPLSRGRTHAAQVLLSRILRVAFRWPTRGVVLLHSHPGGPSALSTADLRTTRTLGQRLALVDIILVDHLVASDHRLLSARAAAHRVGIPLFPLPPA